MAPPPAKRQKRHVVLSSGDEEESSVSAKQQKHEIQNTVTRWASSNGGAKQSLPTRSREKPDEIIAKKSQPTTAAHTSPATSSTFPVKTSRKSKPTNKATASKPISTFFGAATQPQFLNRQKTSKSLSPEVQDGAEDLIEDDSPIDELPQLLGAQKKINTLLDHRKRPLEDKDKDNLSGGGQRFKLGDDSIGRLRHKVVPRAEVHTRPWAERFGPSNLNELMVHKKKVSEVKIWLDNALQGRDRKRILILKGPSGAGKTTTISTLAKAMGLELSEWRNPVGSEISSDGYLSMSARFEDFLGRSGRFGGLEMSDSTGESRDLPIPASHSQSARKKIILLEEFPNTFSTTSSSLRSFRSVILEYLVTCTPQSGYTLREGHIRNVTPLVMVITETRQTTTTAASDSFTAHRLLGSDIMSHPGVGVIDFNPMAATLLTKALDIVIQKEARQSGRRRIPGSSVLKQLSEVGDVRSAIGSLEFLCVRGEDGDDWGGRVASRARKGASAPSAITKLEKESLEMVTQRESSLGIFHAVGKVVYNKRDQVGAAQETLVQPPKHLSDHVRHGASQVSVDRLIDEISTDTETFIAALHENYVLSCEGTSFIDNINGCLDALSVSDMLGSLLGGRFGSGRERGGRSFHGTASDSLRQDEICFQLAVRGLLFSLPDPVKRSAHPVAGKTGGKNDSYKMFFPTSMRLTRRMEEIDHLIGRWTDQFRFGSALHPAGNCRHKIAGTIDNGQEAASCAAQRSSWHTDQVEVEAIRTSLNCTKAELILERLPFMSKIGQRTTAPPRLSELNTITHFHGINALVCEESDEEDANVVAPVARWTTDTPADMEIERSVPAQLVVGQAGKESKTPLLPVEEAVDKMYLSDDDIED